MKTLVEAAAEASSLHPFALYKACPYAIPRLISLWEKLVCLLSKRQYNVISNSTRF
jgi:hypothetical protein